MTVTVVTGIFGGYDQLKTPPPQSIDVDWVCVTDDPFKLQADGVWRLIHQPRSFEVNPRLSAKMPKCLPWTFAKSDPGSEIIWMDASFSVQSETSIERLIAVTKESSGQTWQFTHPNRDCIYTEAAFSAGLPKYVQQPVLEQANYYAKVGHPENWGLWATGLIVYPRWTLHQQLGQSWLLEQLQWTNQDQVSQPYVWHCFGRSPANLPGHLLNNEFVTLHPHLDGT